MWKHSTLNKVKCTLVSFNGSNTEPEEKQLKESSTLYKKYPLSAGKDLYMDRY